MRQLSEYTAIIQDALESLNIGDCQPASLYGPIDYAMRAGGKRIRPVLLLLACEGYGGDILKAVDAACGMEIFHNFTLLHDDVMDNSDLRRGRKTVVAEYGLNAAILSGDTMLTVASELVVHVDDNILRSVMEIFNTMALRIYEGQALDMDFEQRDIVSIEEYIEMVRCKTGVLLGSSLEIGALIGGAGKAEAEIMREIGQLIGIAFQIQDDLLDVYGDSETFGKPIGGDILNDKKTFLYHCVMGKGLEIRNKFIDAMKISDSRLKVETVREIYTQSGAKDDCVEAVQHYTEKAMSLLDSCGMTLEGKDALRNLSEKLISRNK